MLVTSKQEVVRELNGIRLVTHTRGGLPTELDAELRIGDTELTINRFEAKATVTMLSAWLEGPGHGRI